MCAERLLRGAECVVRPAARESRVNETKKFVLRDFAEKIFPLQSASDSIGRPATARPPLALSCVFPLAYSPPNLCPNSPFVRFGHPLPRRPPVSRSPPPTDANTAPKNAARRRQRRGEQFWPTESVARRWRRAKCCAPSSCKQNAFVGTSLRNTVVVLTPFCSLCSELSEVCDGEYLHRSGCWRTPLHQLHRRLGETDVVFRVAARRPPPQQHQLLGMEYGNRNVSHWHHSAVTSTAPLHPPPHNDGYFFGGAGGSADYHGAQTANPSLNCAYQSYQVAAMAANGGAANGGHSNLTAVASGSGANGYRHNASMCYAHSLPVSSASTSSSYNYIGLPMPLSGGPPVSVGAPPSVGIFPGGNSQQLSPTR
ncbi:hypothetical protein V9T40_008607 [Parthenolecanium corni]|uniref:Uncharacterized protein n=1 Tax=Parthenolecanium corni TaxID=536013 RepID=A0AAN9TNE9_9HEMI